MTAPSSDYREGLLALAEWLRAQAETRPPETAEALFAGLSFASRSPKTAAAVAAAEALTTVRRLLDDLENDLPVKVPYWVAEPAGVSISGLATSLAEMQSLSDRKKLVKDILATCLTFWRERWRGLRSHCVGIMAALIFVGGEDGA